MYRTLRDYGRIIDIVVQPSSSKDTPRYAIVRFAWVRSASAARNCSHGQVIKGTRISIVYEKTLGFFETINKWMRDHPRIMVNSPSLNVASNNTFTRSQSYWRCWQGPLTSSLILSEYGLLATSSLVASQSEDSNRLYTSTGSG